MVDSEAVKVHALQALPGKNPLASPFSRHTSKKPELAARAFFWNAKRTCQAAGLNSFDALVFIGSAVSAATFWLSSASCLL